MDNSNQYTATYQFTHKSTGKKVIAQNWSQFYTFQRDNNYSLDYRNGINHIRTWVKGTQEIEERVNQFWQGAVGYEKIGQLRTSGVCGNPIRVVLKNMINHAAMQGDREIYNTLCELDKYYWSDTHVGKHGNIHQLLLTN